jgi:hypothetical protein
LLQQRYLERSGEMGTHILNFIKNTLGAGYQWLTPVILATLEAEIRRISVRSQPWQIVQENLSQKTLSQKTGLVE